MSVILEARELVRDLGDTVPVRVLHGIDLRVHEGEFVSLTGASGSGKSTLLYLLGALDKPTSGDVLVDGVNVGALDDDARARVRSEKLGFVFQFHFLLPEFNALENVAIPMLRQGIARAKSFERASEVLERLGLGELTRRKPHQLSGGQQQRVAIARAIAHRPRVVLADEPTGSLDSKTGTAVMDILERLVREEGLTVVMVTHERAFAARAARLLVMQDGAIVSDTSPSR